MITPKELITEIEFQLQEVIQEARQRAVNYSDDTHSQANFEVGYLNGRIKTVLHMIEEYKQQKR